MNSASAYNLDVMIARPRQSERERCESLTGSREILEIVWEGSSAELRRLVLAMGISPGSAEDLLQDVYLTALQKSPVDLVAAELRLWLFRVASNRCRLEYRKRQRWGRVFSKLVACWRGEERVDALADERRAMVKQALDALPADVRTLVVLRYYNDLNSKQIGRIVDLPDTTVRSHLRRARRNMAEALQDLGQHDEL